ncbi:hypothetical protein ACHAXH_000247 [Discostella pseudostelligera]
MPPLTSLHYTKRMEANFVEFEFPYRFSDQISWLLLWDGCQKQPVCLQILSLFYSIDVRNA